MTEISRALMWARISYRSATYIDVTLDRSEFGYKSTLSLYAGQRQSTEVV